MKIRAFFACLAFSIINAASQTNYADWATSHYGSTTSEESQPGADGDNDGLSNLEEYNLLSDPKAYTADPNYHSLVTHPDGITRIHYFFPLRQVSDLIFEVRVADNLKDLASGGNHLIVYKNQNGTTFIADGFLANISPPVVEIYDSVPQTASTPRRFLSLAVLYNPLPSQTGGSISFAVIGNPGNEADPPPSSSPEDPSPRRSFPLGAVPYVFEMSRYEITNAQYVEFLNAVARFDPTATGALDYRPLYKTKVNSDARGGITRTPATNTPPYTYTVKAKMGNKPVNFVSFYDACRFCNWLHNGKPTGDQTNATTEDGAYDLTDPAIVASNNVTRKPGARFFIPNNNEWHKAAFYDPTIVGSHKYWRYPDRSNTLPTAALADSDGNASNPGLSTLNYARGSADWDSNLNGITEDGNVLTVGSLRSFTYYGICDMGGNLSELMETKVRTTQRYYRGGSWNGEALWILSSNIQDTDAFGPGETHEIGFRVAKAHP